MRSITAHGFAHAARAIIAADGLGGMSLRAVAGHAGASIGALSHHVGNRLGLIAEVIKLERADRARHYAQWLSRGAALDLGDPCTLSLFVTGYLDNLARGGRESALSGCELLLEAGRDPAGLSGMASLLQEEDRFWTQLLEREHGARAALFGPVVAAYCRDELPFATALTVNPDYVLLRAATVTRLAESLADHGADLPRHFDALVAACGRESASAPLLVDLPAGSRKAEIAAHVGAIIAEQGLAAVTHRAVAARAGISNSNVAHHFRTGADLIEAGMGALIQEMRQELQMEAAPPGPNRHRGVALIRATHAIALLAARDPAYLPFALDMRRRRAENVRAGLAIQLGLPPTDGAALQAATMAIIGSALAGFAAPDRTMASAVTAETLASLRTTAPEAS